MKNLFWSHWCIIEHVSCGLNNNSILTAGARLTQDFGFLYFVDQILRKYIQNTSDRRLMPLLSSIGKNTLGTVWYEFYIYRNWHYHEQLSNTPKATGDKLLSLDNNREQHTLILHATWSELNYKNLNQLWSRSTATSKKLLKIFPVIFLSCGP